VLCIEPSASNVRDLRGLIDLNGLRDVEVLQTAVGSTSGLVPFLGGINGGVAPSDALAAERVPMARLDDVVSRRVDFVKIDVEGYEACVIEGADRVIAQHRPVLFVEMHPHILPTYGGSLLGLVRRLRRDYSRIQVYERRSDPGALVRLAHRYSRRGDVGRVRDVDAYLERFDGCRDPHTFWVACLP
jgi:FkbM family methyltransferase